MYFVVLLHQSISKVISRLGKPQKSSFFRGPATKRGGGKGRDTKKKKTYFEARKKKNQKKMGPLSKRGKVRP